MQWCAGAGAGFTLPAARPWLPLHEDYPERNVEAQRSDPKSLLNFYRRLIAVRRASPALQGGMRQALTFGTRYLLAYLRQTSDQTVLVALNFSGRRKRLVLGSHLSRANFRLLLSTSRTTFTPPREGLLPVLHQRLGGVRRGPEAVSQGSHPGVDVLQ